MSTLSPLKNKIGFSDIHPGDYTSDVSEKRMEKPLFASTPWETCRFENEETCCCFDTHDVLESLTI